MPPYSEDPIDPAQAWFWEPAWLEGETEAAADIAAGRVDTFATDEELLAALATHQIFTDP